MSIEKLSAWLKQWLVFLILGLLTACTPTVQQRQVVIYTSVDQVYAEPILQRYEEMTGVRVLAVYDVEATKTTGLVNRLLAEVNNPQADVFWNGEIVQTLLLKEQGILAAYESPEAQITPSIYKDPAGYWTGFGGRARVFIINTDRLAPGDYPLSIFDLITPDRTADVGVANPLFGTTATHAAALYAAVGAEQGRSFFEQLQTSAAQIVDGNSVVRDLVANGQLDYGLTDTDDACGAIQRGQPVAIVFPDQDPGDLGTLLIPNTVALVAGAPNPEEGRVLIDYLLSYAVEVELLQSGWFSLSLRPDINFAEINAPCLLETQVQGMQVRFEDIYRYLNQSKNELTEIFVR
ncbi:MAG: extracellular solute-binding protein [Anaerolineales bacterium]|nr:extracellular solute-binding protein [Anaerolineales bacterium]